MSIESTSYREGERFCRKPLGLYVLAVMLLIATGIKASSPLDGYTPSSLTPGAPAGTYPLSGFETVNLYNGNLNFSLHLGQVIGRGAAQWPIFFNLETTHWMVETYAQPYNCTPTQICYNYFYYPNESAWIGTKGPSDLYGRQIAATYDLNCQSGNDTARTRLTFRSPDGTEFELVDPLTGGVEQSVFYAGCYPYSQQPFNRGRIFVTTDGSAATFISDQDVTDYYIGTRVIYPSGYLLLRDGTRYRIRDGWIAWLRDRNGNQLTFTRNASTPNRVIDIKDSIGRQVTYTYSSETGLGYDEITFIGFGGLPKTIRIYIGGSHNENVVLRRDYRSSQGGAGFQTYQQLFPGLNGSYSGVYYPYSPSAIELPDHRFYRLYYSPYGHIARVELPTGGAIEYDASVTQAGLNDIRQRVVARRTYLSSEVDAPINGITTYTAGLVSNNTYVKVNNYNGGLVNQLLLGAEEHYFYSSPSISANPFSINGWDEGREYKSQFLGSDGTNPTSVIRRFETTWQLRSCPGGLDNPQIVETLTTLLESNQVSKQTFAYDCYNNQTDTYEYDIGTGSPGSLIRHTHTNYKTDGYDAIIGGQGNPDPISTTHVRNLPTIQTVQDAGGIVRAKTEYEYDGYAQSPLGGLESYSSVVIQGLVSRSGLTQVQGYNPAADVTRGNVTKVTRWLLATTGSVLQDTPIYSYSRYDVAGNVVKTRDPKGNDVTFDYSDSFSSGFTANTFAFLKSTTSPASAAPFGGGISLNLTIVYDFSSGKVVSTTDPNGQVTSFEYNDPLDRLTKITRPLGGGDTTYQYGDTVGDLFLLTKTKQAANITLDDYALFDGLGRTTRTAHCEAKSSGICTSMSARETKYDALGRVSQGSNPEFIPSYNAPFPNSALWTTTTYDALSRVTTVMTPDGAHVDTAYLGNKVTVTDQAGKTRSSITDGLGRLVQVNEDPSATVGDGHLNYQTNYTYDVLGNLIRVRQGGSLQESSGNVIQTRSFFYDSLSRLIYANNPEQDATLVGPSGTRWTMKYQYDDNGNLIKRTDARNIVTDYSYDALNRNTKVCYSDNTLPVFHYYDPYIANGKGRLWKVENHLTCDQNSPVTKSSTVVNSYDAIGRVTSQSQQFQKSDNTWFAFPAVTRTYDLAGHVVTQYYPSGNLITNTYDAAGRLTQFYGTLGFPSGAAYAKQIIYNAAGQMIKEAFDTQEPLYHNIAYNNRFQMVENRLGTTPNDPQTWSRGKLVFYYGTTARNTSNPFADSPDNNGNVLRQEHYVPTTVTPNTPLPSVVLSYVIPMRDDYEYDPLNRLKKIIGRQFDGSVESQIYTQTFTYDPFGNRKIDAANTSGAGINNKVFEVNKRNNRLSGQVYDAAGNVINDSYAFRLNDRKYDAENRMTQATGTNGAANYYVYDGDGRRVRRIVNSAEIWQVYGIDGELLAEYAASTTATNPQTEYGYRGGQLLITAESGGQVKWLVSDHLGTPRIILDGTGSLGSVRRHDYLPFGEDLTLAMAGGILRNGGNGYAADTIREKFTGYERDSETDLDYAQTRYCSSKQGRFTSVDRVKLTSSRLFDPQALNLYSYVRNNPLAFADPDGMDWYKNDSDGMLYWYKPGENPSKGYSLVNIGSDGYQITNLQGATGQYAQYNGHNVTLYNDPARPLVDNGVYLPLPPSIDPNLALPLFVGLVKTEAVAVATATSPVTITLGALVIGAGLLQKSDASPKEDPEDDDLKRVILYRGADGLNPGAFRVDPDGVSVFEHPQDGRKYNIRFDGTYRGPKIPGTIAIIDGVPGLEATYTPQHGGPFHWSLNMPGQPEAELKKTLSNYAKSQVK